MPNLPGGDAIPNDDDIPEAVDMGAVVAILQRTYPELDAQEIVEQVLKLMAQQTKG